MVRVKNLTYHYPRNANAALNDLSLEIPAGQFCAHVGANGAGKSTLCYALSGFIPHFYHGKLQGIVEVDGRNVPASELADLAGQIGLVFSNPFNQITGAKFSVRGEIAFGLENLGVSPDEMHERTERVMTLTGLTDLGERSPFELSGGQQQRLAIASVLVMEPRVLVLDEPTAQLDPAGTREVFSLLRSLAASGQATVILAGHKLEWVALNADRVVVLHEGKVVADGTPLSILAGRELESSGLRPTRYTQAARKARDAGLVPSDRNEPVTLGQAVGFFR